MDKQSIVIIEAGPELKDVVLNLGLYYIYDYTDCLAFRLPGDWVVSNGRIREVLGGGGSVCVSAESRR